MTTPGMSYLAEEIVYVLQGTFTDQYRSSGPGTVIRGEPGRSHQPGTPDGVTFMVVRSLAPGERAHRRERLVHRPRASGPMSRPAMTCFWIWAVPSPIWYPNTSRKRCWNGSSSDQP
jgi:hypothetical protein